MIDLYKIGYDNYFKTGELIDKNSGIFEYNRIRLELLFMNDANTLIIINGRFSSQPEKDDLLRRMQLYRRRIFIASDIVAFTENKEVIEQCQYLLHQCPNGSIPGFNMKQQYSYVPELFFTDDIALPVQDSLLCFGGGYRGNEERINAYLKAVPSVSFTKHDDGTDNRLTYDEYREEMRRHKFNLIISRKEYTKLGWITARFFETVSFGVLPVVDSEYDSTNYLNAEKCTPDTVKQFIDDYSDDDKRWQKIAEYQQRIIDKRHMFRNIIKSIIRER